MAGVVFLAVCSVSGCLYAGFSVFLLLLRGTAVRQLLAWGGGHLHRAVQPQVTAIYICTC